MNKEETVGELKLEVSRLERHLQKTKIRLNQLEKFISSQGLALPEEIEMDVSVLLDTPERTDYQQILTNISVIEDRVVTTENNDEKFEYLLEELREKTNLIGIQDEKISDMKLRLEMNEDFVEEMGNAIKQLELTNGELENKLEEQQRELSKRLEKIEQLELEVALGVEGRSKVIREIGKEGEFDKISEQEYLEQIVNSHRIIVELKSRYDSVMKQKTEAEVMFGFRLDERDEIIQILERDLADAKRRSEEAHESILLSIKNGRSNGKIVKKIKAGQSAAIRRSLILSQSLAFSQAGEEMSFFNKAPKESAYNLLKKFKSNFEEN